MFYGVEYKHGSDMVGGTVLVHLFNTRQERNEWVSDGSAYVGAGERAALRATDRLARDAKQLVARGMESPVQLTD